MTLDADILKGMRRLYGKLTDSKDMAVLNWRQKTLVERLEEAEQKKEKVQKNHKWRNSQKKLFKGKKHDHFRHRNETG